MKTSQNRILKALPTIAALLTLIAASGHAATSSANPFADAFVTTGANNNLVNSNYGGAGLLGVSAPGAAQGEFQSALEFDLSTIRNAFNTQFGAGQWTVTSATLQLTSAAANNGILNTPSAGSFDISLMQNNSWTEGLGTPAAPGATGITFNSLQPLINNAVDQDLGTFSFNGTTSGANVYTLNLTSGLISDILGGSDASFRMSAANSTINYLFNSKNFGTAGNRPLLTISAVPEPGSAAICAMGFAAVWGWRSLRRTRQ
jgi:hypothetical protein